jgi:hypothetical protein
VDCLRHYHKHPADVLRITVDWAPWLEGSTITGSLWQCVGLTLSSPAFTPTTTAVSISGGVAGGLYEVKNRITTSSGMVEVRRLRISLKKLAPDDPEQVGWRTEALS